MKKFVGAIVLFLSFTAQSQDKIPITEKDYNNQEVEMADTFRKEGKIYVVVGVISIILVGLFGYAVHIDRKITRLENENSQK